MNAVPRVASTSAVVALVLATLWLFWPVEWGGGTTYVSTYGNSMEPGFSTGDLVVLTAADSYSIGDVVAYRSESLDTVVMHRIVAEESGRFLTQGDNNDWLDDDRPTKDEVLGRLFFSIPNGGAALDGLRSPAVLLPVGVGVLALLGTAARTPRGRHALRRVRQRVPTTSPSFAMPVRARARQVALGAAAVAVVAAVGCVVLLVLPTTETQTRSVQVTQEGQYVYSGRAKTGTTYPTGAVTTGDTVWNRLVEDLTVSLDASVTGPSVSGVAGAVNLDVVLSAPDGWSAVLTSGAPAAFTDGRATAAVAVDPEAAAELLGRHYEETGTVGGSATLTVTPVGAPTGTVQGQRFTAEALPGGLAFTLDETSLRPTSTDATVFTPSTSTSVDIEEVGPRTLAVLALTVSIGDARTIAGAVLLLSLATLCVAAWVGRIGRGGGVADRFLVRHADRILPVTSFSPGATVIDVSDAESLHRVAERFDTVVLHHAGEDQDVFAVRDVDATYRFVVPGPADRRRGKPPVPAPAPVADRTDRTAPLARVDPASREGLWGRVA